MPANVADTVIGPAGVDFVVLTVKVPFVRPAAIVTDGVITEPAGLAESWITNPPVGAMELIVTVPVEVPPALTVAGASFTETSTGGLIVRVADFCKVP